MRVLGDRRTGDKAAIRGRLHEGKSKHSDAPTRCATQFFMRRAQITSNSPRTAGHCAIVIGIGPGDRAPRPLADLKSVAKPLKVLLVMIRKVRQWLTFSSDGGCHR